MTPDPILVALIAANNLIADPRRWSKKPWEPSKTYCVHTAVCVAADDDDSPAHIYLRRVLAAPDPMEVFRWNDAPERTHAEVMAVFAKAIDMRRQELGIPTHSEWNRP